MMADLVKTLGVSPVKILEGMSPVIEDAKKELDKFIGGNKAAGVRLRKHMQSLKGRAQAIREIVSAKPEDTDRGK